MKNIILLHGALGGSHDLAPLSLSLKNQDLDVHTFSFSGHAQSAFQSSFGIEQFAGELETFLLGKHLKNVFVFGYSMGGYVALYLASQKQNLIQGVVTLGTKFDWNAETVDKETRMLEPERMLEKIPGFANALELKHGGGWKELVNKTACMMHEINKNQFLSPLVLNSLKIPVCLGLADKDQMVSLEETLTVFKTLPNATMYMLPGSRHPIETVNIELLSRVIHGFVNKS